MKKIIMTGGGTAGHVNPNLALVPKLRQLSYEIKYIGSKNGIEKEIIGKTKIPYFGISSGKLRRYFDLKNFTDPFKVGAGFFQSLHILRKEKPDIVFSKGGFVSVPVVAAASFLRIPVLAHESDLTPGLANKLASRFVDRLLVTFPDTVSKIGEKAILVGSPIREDLYKGDGERAREAAGFTENKPVLLVMGGSIGSVKINTTLRKILPELLPIFNIIHLCGKNNLDESLKETLGYKQYEYVVEEMKDILQAADLIVSRAGSNSIFEFLALRKPNLLIPLSKGASRGDQIENAQSFYKSGYSMVLVEEELTDVSLRMSILKLYEDREKFISHMEESQLSGATDKILELIEKYSK
ncbi:undecaprenyldiphospho-muramoylpentapeptide beta-N-acetylglucosaminyltransferase [Proteiniclasticum sp. SCR006]|uniref:UDP-N-acetylglucosamine--N-acetylmuramyl-(pentapeptide) pyrophosphoryl-undecaprenol N-acetylglucosamine transferase n=2 Tax=Proteiniclasticum aestuarii TaxID=2817862 RepID=A0A939HD06_9CLOT|nr:undecaprenyldiphospho-muramoylpentapeptide beta-N-acetylglucosaminyltransferase [Proteiniclasticum aestuarii]MBO1265706.1 undecaprenyldiphospho-muramoylpentapeptide beta-N-acetylglucosaminyltransferase [Proteiniclasticum aestuarii]